MERKDIVFADKLLGELKLQFIDKFGSKEVKTKFWSMCDGMRILKVRFNKETYHLEFFIEVCGWVDAEVIENIPKRISTHKPLIDVCGMDVFMDVLKVSLEKCSAYRIIYHDWK